MNDIYDGWPPGLLVLGPIPSRAGAAWARRSGPPINREPLDESETHEADDEPHEGEV